MKTNAPSDALKIKKEIMTIQQAMEDYTHKIVDLERKLEKVREWVKADLRHQINNKIYQENDRDYLMRQGERIICQEEVKEILNQI